MPRHSNTFLTLALTFLYFLGLLIDVSWAQHWEMIDDADSRISYSGVWAQGPCGPSCLYPNLSNVQNQTWHVAQPSRSSAATSVSIQFTGYGVFVGILTDDTDNIHMSVKITLDDRSWDYYRESQLDGTIGTGAVLLYYDNLVYGPHSLTIDVYAESIFLLDYISYQDSLTNTVDTPPGTTSVAVVSSTDSPPSSTVTRPSATQSLTSTIVSVGPSGTTTMAVTLPAGNFISDVNTQNNATTSFNPATFTSDVHGVTVSMSTTVDSAGNTVVFPVLTITDSGDDSNPTATVHHTSSAETSTAFSPALAGAIGAAVAAVAAALVVVFMVCMKRRKRIRPRPGSAEPYMLANSTPSSQNSHLTQRLSPDPYAPESVLGLFTMPQGPDYRMQPDILLSSPPPNHSLMSPISPNRQYHPSQNNTVTTPSSDQYLNPYTNSNSLSTPISPSYPQPYYASGALTQQQQQQQQHMHYGYPVDKLSRHSSNHLSQRYQSNMAELRSPVTPLIPRPADWNIESQSETGVQQTAPTQTPIQLSPAMLLPSPAILTPSPRSPRRRSGRQKEVLDEQLHQQQQQQGVPPNHTMSGVPILGHPSALRRGRRRTDGAELPPRRREGGMRSPASDEESLPPVVRRQSLSHPAPPAYSPPRMVRNTDLHDILLD